MEPIKPDADNEGQSGVGELLRARRTERGLTVAAASADLRIRSGYITAIEEGHYGDLPGRAYAVGFVRGYAEFLGLDGDEIVRRYKQESDAFAGRAELVFPTAVSESSIPGGWLLTLALAVAVVAYGAWYLYQSRVPSLEEGVPALPERLAALIHQPVGNTGSEVVPVPRQDAAKPTAEAAHSTTLPAAPQQAASPQSTPSQQPASPEDVVPPAEEESAPAESQSAVPAAKDAKAKRETKAAEAKPGLSDHASAANPQPVETAPGEPPAKISAVETMRPGDTTNAPKAPPAEENGVTSSRVVLRADQDCWIEIRDSSTGQVIHSRLLRKGETYAVPNRSGLLMTAGNAGALAIVVDGKPQAPLGRLGMVRRDIVLDPDSFSGDSERRGAAPNE